MYIDGNLEGPYGERRKISGMPTIMFTVSSVIKDIKKCITMDAKFPGDLVYILGETKNELGGGEYYQMMDVKGLHVPQVDALKFLPLYLSLYQAIERELISSAHAVSRGGLAIHLAMIAMGGEVGMEIDLGSVLCHNKLSDTQILYSESAGRFVVTVDPKKRKDFENLFPESMISHVGFVREPPFFRIGHKNDSWMIEEEISSLKDAWEKPFGELI
jgi:phosphoribosylformylglycinamidine synthase